MKITLVNEFIQFILDNYKWLVILACSILFFILQIIIKRRPAIFDNSAFSNVCKLIKDAEEKYGAGNGAEKLRFVLDNLDLPNSSLRSAYSNVIEYILSLPQKKKG